MPSLVSILIPAYNSARWFAQTLASVIAQTWPSKEIIIVDDGSKDETLAVARSFASPIVKLVTQSNQGAAAARNHAFSLCQGDYIQYDRVGRIYRGHVYLFQHRREVLRARRADANTNTHSNSDAYADYNTLAKRHGDRNINSERNSESYSHAEVSSYPSAAPNSEISAIDSRL